MASSFHAQPRARSRGKRNSETVRGMHNDVAQHLKHNFLDNAETPIEFQSRAARLHRKEFADSHQQNLSAQDRQHVKKMPLYDMRPWWQKSEDDFRVAKADATADQGTGKAAAGASKANDDGFDTSAGVNMLLEVTQLRHERSKQCHSDRTRNYRKAFSRCNDGPSTLSTPRTHVTCVSANDLTAVRKQAEMQSAAPQLTPAQAFLLAKTQRGAVHGQNPEARVQPMMNLSRPSASHHSMASLNTADGLVQAAKHREAAIALGRREKSGGWWFDASGSRPGRADDDVNKTLNVAAVSQAWEANKKTNASGTPQTARTAAYESPL